MYKVRDYRLHMTKVGVVIVLGNDLATFNMYLMFPFKNVILLRVNTFDAKCPC